MARTATARRKPSRSRRARVAPEMRRQQLIEHASRILTARGPEWLQITELAAAAGVSRPLVYRLFPTRQALVRAVLEDFSERVSERFRDALVRALPSSVEMITTAFVEASCDAIAERGAGPWRLLDSRGADPAIAKLGREIFAMLLAPWEEQLGGFLGVPQRRAANLLGVIVAAGRAGLDGWIDGVLTRAEAVSDATRAVSALLVAFAARE